MEGDGCHSMIQKSGRDVRFARLTFALCRFWGIGSGMASDLETAVLDGGEADDVDTRSAEAQAVSAVLANAAETEPTISDARIAAIRQEWRLLASHMV